MIGRLNHIAIAVLELNAAIQCYRDLLGAKVSPIQNLPNHGVRLAFVNLPNTKVELMEPLGKNSPISKFLAKNQNGAIHHICYEVQDIEKAKKKILEKGARILGDGVPKIGSHNKRIIFLHPNDFQGTLIELMEE